MAKLVKLLTILQLVIESQRKKRKNAGQGNRFRDFDGLYVNLFIFTAPSWRHCL